jgi:hypothetical protein
VCYRDSRNPENIMSIHREERGQYLIEASAFHLPGGNQWQPRLTMTRLRDERALPRSQSFPGLSPLFETAKGAIRYATDLGRRMADEGSPRLRV